MLARKNPAYSPVQSFCSVEEIQDFEKKYSDVERMNAFHGVATDQLEYITILIRSYDGRCRNLVFSYQINSDTMNFEEVETWKREFELMHFQRALHLRLFVYYQGRDYVFQENIVI